MKKLTGKSRYRTSWCGQIILQVEVHDRWFIMFKGWQEKTVWRDATVKDLSVMTNWESRR